MSGICSLFLTVAAAYSTFFSGTEGIERMKVYLWAAAGITFLFANYTAWRREHLKVVSESPAIEMYIDQVRWEMGANNNTVLIFAVYLINSGAPSITRGWYVTIKVGNGDEEKLEHFHASSPWVIHQDGQTVTLHPGDSIVAKTLERRLETGEGKAGRIFFALKGDRINQLASANFKAKLGCFDFKGKLTQKTFIPHGAPLSGVQLYPSEEGTIIPPLPPLSDTTVSPPAE